jgi:hypothetical protein
MLPTSRYFLSVELLRIVEALSGNPVYISQLGRISPKLLES